MNGGGVVKKGKVLKTFSFNGISHNPGEVIDVPADQWDTWVKNGWIGPTSGGE
jgi:hypothetical protein